MLFRSLKERKTASELGGQFGVHPNQVTEWRKQLVSEASSLFERGSSKAVVEEGRNEVLPKDWTSLGEE